jgi:hypothetical protein
MKKFLSSILLLNFISAALFIAFEPSLRCDEPLHIFDLRNYATYGLALKPMLLHRNAPGPTGYLWMSAGIHLLPGNALTDARIAILLSWVLLSAVFIIGAQTGPGSPNMWYGALLALLVCPHTIEATATLLTEGPALFFGMSGFLAWIEFLSPSTKSAARPLLGYLGGLSMGLAVTCRQYFLALLIAAAFVPFILVWQASRKLDFRWLLRISLPLILAAVPVVAMVLVWKGFSSPAMVDGGVYNSRWKAAVGLNLLRPLIATYYVAVYLLPLTFPAILRLKRSLWLPASMATILGCAVVFRYRDAFLQLGAFNGVIRLASRAAHVGMALFILVTGVAIYNAFAVVTLLWERRQSMLGCAPVVFSLLLIGFFVFEQIAVAGNVPFYDRYIMQIAPFLGFVAFALLPELTWPRLSALASLSAVSHFMLWRFF